MVGLWAVRGAWRGFSRELFGLAALGVGLVAATVLGPVATREAAARWSLDPRLAAVLARAVLFLVPYVAFQVVGALLHRLGRAVFLGGVDRFFGALFGAGAAVLGLGAILVVSAHWGMPARWVQDSRLAGPLADAFQVAASWAARWIG